jgi:hypothetical protein
VGISNDGTMLLYANKDTIFMAETNTYKPVLIKRLNGYFNSECIISPDKRYFIFSKTRTFELSIISETRDLWIYDLKTNKEKLLIREGGPIFGGFWIE